MSQAREALQSERPEAVFAAFKLGRELLSEIEPFFDEDTHRRRGSTVLARTVRFQPSYLAHPGKNLHRIVYDDAHRSLVDRYQPLPVVGAMPDYVPASDELKHRHPATFCSVAIIRLMLPSYTANKIETLTTRPAGPNLNPRQESQRAGRARDLAIGIRWDEMHQDIVSPDAFSERVLGLNDTLVDAARQKNIQFNPRYYVEGAPIVQFVGRDFRIHEATEHDPRVF